MPEARETGPGIDALFVATPEAFTKDRNALAERLKEEGDPEAARRVSALRRPTRSAWAVNRLVHEDPSATRELLDAGRALRLAQRRALSGGGAEQLRELSEARRKLVSDLTKRAAAALGANPSQGIIEEIAATFEAATADEDAGHQVLEGHLSKPLARPAGFGDATGLSVVAAGVQEEGASSATEHPAEPAVSMGEIRAAERRERRAREGVERLRAEVAALQERLAESKARLRAAEAEARGAAVQLKRLQR